MRNKPEGMYSIATVCKQFWEATHQELYLSQVLAAVASHKVKLYLNCPEAPTYCGYAGTGFHQHEMYTQDTLQRFMERLPAAKILNGYYQVTDDAFIEKFRQLTSIDDSREQLAKSELYSLFPNTLKHGDTELSLCFVRRLEVHGNPLPEELADTRPPLERYFVDGAELYDALSMTATSESIQLQRAYKEIETLQNALNREKASPGNQDSYNRHAEAFAAMQIALVKLKNESTAGGRKISKISTHQIQNILSEHVPDELLPSKSLLSDRRADFVRLHGEEPLFLK